MTAIDRLTDEQIRTIAIEHFADESKAHPLSWGPDSLNEIWLQEIGIPFARSVESEVRALLAGAAEGWQLVPNEPTQEMLDAADKVIDADPLWITRAYCAMLAAAPGAAAALAITPAQAVEEAGMGKAKLGDVMEALLEAKQHIPEAATLFHERNDRARRFVAAALRAATKEQQP